MVTYHQPHPSDIAKWFNRNQEKQIHVPSHSNSNVSVEVIDYTIRLRRNKSVIITFNIIYKELKVYTLKMSTILSYNKDLIVWIVAVLVKNCSSI